MGRCTVSESIVHSGELALNVLFTEAYKLEGLQHDLGIVVTNSAGGKLYAVADQIVLECGDGKRICLAFGSLLEDLKTAVGHGEGVVTEFQLAGLLTDLVHGEVDDPAELIALLIHVLGAECAQLVAENAGGLLRCQLLAGGRFVTLSTAEFLGKKPEDITIITCHLGNGCSMAAVKNGKVIDTTMGLTPLEGLMMGTRSGDMDPAAVLRMVEVGNTAKEVDTILNKKSGLLAVGGIGSGDMRDIVNAADSGNKDAALALKMFIRRIVKYIGSYYVLLGGADAIVFTGGIGEHSIPERKAILDGIACLGIKCDDAKNKDCFGKAGVISTDDSAWKAIVMPTNEELMIALETVKTLGL